MVFSLDRFINIWVHTMVHSFLLRIIVVADVSLVGKFRCYASLMGSYNGALYFAQNNFCSWCEFCGQVQMLGIASAGIYVSHASAYCLSYLIYKLIFIGSHSKRNIDVYCLQLIRSIAYILLQLINGQTSIIHRRLDLVGKG